MNWSKSSKNNGFYILLFLGVIASSNAQSTLQDYKKAYPDYNELIINNAQFYDISIEDKKLKVIQDNHYESIILSENGIMNNEESFSYSDLVKLKSYDAYTLTNNNGREKKIKVTQTNEKQARESSVFYSDVKERKLIFPNLEAGAKKVYDYQTEVVDPYLLHKFIFGSGLPIQNSTIEIRTAKDITLGYKTFNDPNNAIEFTKTEKRGGWIYKWTLKDVKPVKFESNSPGYLYSIPNINIYIKDYTVDDKKIEMLDDVSKLFAYYKGYTQNLNKTEDPALKAITEQVTANQTTDADKMKSIFYWVKDNIKYIAFENGYEGFIPREASLVCERKFGDCKDMASIISSMAKYAGVKDVNMAWIGSRNLPYTYEELSTPGVDDHMIAVFKDGDKYVFLDATDKETYYGIPTAFIQGKEALFSHDGSYKIIKVPVVPAEVSAVNENVKLTIDADKLVGSGKIEFNGYNRSHLLARMGDITNKTRFEYIKSLVIKGNNKFNLKDYKEENIENRDKPFVVGFNFDLDNYILKIDKEMYINLFLDKHFETMNIEKDRVSKYDFDFLSAVNSQYELEVPQNYTVKYVPKDFHLDNNLLKADFTFETKGNKINLSVKLAQKKMTLDNADFALWNESIKKLKSTYLETIILSEK
jgi:transglutaminase-like putative cysteine protease